MNASASGEAEVLRVEGLRTIFSSGDSVVEAVRDVDLSLSQGQKLGIVGESGSGKSALALSILGLLEPPGHVVAGSIVLNGRELRGLGDRKLQAIRGKEIAIVFQDPMTSLDPVKTIGKQIGDAIRQHQPKLGKARTRAAVIELLRDVEIPFPDRRLDDYPHQYSGGMRQRVMIAIALANEPDVLIADEPTTALDVTTQAQILTLLERLVEDRGTAVILITHNLGVVAEFCDAVGVMYAGRLVERASTGELFERQAHPYTEALLRAVPRPDQLQAGPLMSIPGAPPDLANLGPGCPFEPRCALGHGEEICQTVTPPEVAIAGPHGTRFAECHFALDRAHDTAALGGSEAPARSTRA